MGSLYFTLSGAGSRGPTVTVKLEALAKMQRWTNLAADHDRECSGIGMATKDSEGNILVYESFLLAPEYCSHSYVELDTQHQKMVMQHLLQTRPEELANLVMGWHSHVDFSTFWSGTDEIQSRTKLCPDSDWTVSLVTNTAGELKARIDFPKERKEPIHDLHLRVEVPVRETLLEKTTVFFDKYVRPRLGAEVKKGRNEELRLAGSKSQNFNRIMEEPVPGRTPSGDTPRERQKTLNWNPQLPVRRTLPRDGMLSGVTPNYPR